MWRARADEIAREAESIAADVAELEARLRATSAAVTALISGAAGREDRAMTSHLGAAAARSRETGHTLRRAAVTVRGLSGHA